MGGVAEAIMKMGFGNGYSFAFDESLTMDDIFDYTYGSVVLEMADGSVVDKVLVVTTEDGAFSYKGETLAHDSVLSAYEDKLENVFSCNIPAAKGQTATQYVDLNGETASDNLFNPNGSMYAIEGITSPDGRVFSKMGHSERIGAGLYRNVLGNYDIQMFKAAVEYFK